MDLVPVSRDPLPQKPHEETALVPLATTALRRAGWELPPVCLALSSSTLIGLRVYLEECTRQLAQRTSSAATVATYRKRGRAFVLWLEQGRPPDLRRLDRACLEAYRAYLDQKFANPRTKNGYLTAVRHFLTFLGTYHPGLINAAEFVKGWSCSRTHTRRHLPVEDAKALLAALESDPRKSELQRARNGGNGREAAMARNSELESASHTRPHFVLPLALSSHDGGLNLAIPLMTP